MDIDSTPIHTDLVLLGGGHSQVAVLKSFGMQPLPGVRLTLVSRDVHTPYSGMLPGYIAGHYDYDTFHIDLRPLARFAGARLIHAAVNGLDLDNNTLLFADRPPLRFDWLSINTGSRPPLLTVPGAAEYAVPVKPIDRFLLRWAEIIRQVCASSGPYHMVVAGAGAGGVELLLACQYYLHKRLREQNDNPDRLRWTLVSASPDILPGHNPKVRAIFTRVLAERGIKVLCNVAVTQVGPDSIQLSDGQSLPATTVFWVTGAAAAPWLRESGLATTEQGFVQVNDSLQSVSHPQVFATGDIAHVVNHPRPKSGVFAVRQGPPLTANLRRVLNGKAPQAFRPQRQFLSLISTGDPYAVASRGRWATEGRWLWRWKDRIDRAFMTRYQRLPGMPATSATAPTEMRCAGCGAKIGAAVLNRALARMPAPVQKDEIVTGLNSPDDTAVLAPPAGKLWLQSVDYFPALVDDPYLFGQIAANHALNDIFAMAAEPHSALALVTLPHAAPRLQEETLFQILSGMQTVLIQQQTALIGGHSSEGAELACGLSVNGLVEPDQLLRKTGLQCGDQLILTKPLGSGVLFAADMRRLAKGRWIDAALAVMLQSNAAASRILQQHGAHACTDITGFGLAGHLLEMLRPAHLAAHIELTALPLLDGALEVCQLGIESSLAPANRIHEAVIKASTTLTAQPAYTLLFDPQTAGGLLAGIPAEQSTACLAALQQQGYQAANIGSVIEGNTGIELTLDT